MKLDVFLQGVSPNAIAFYKGRVKRGNSEDLCVLFKRNARGENVKTFVTYAAVNECSPI